MGGRHYLAYLLRMWQAEDKNGVAWRASLEDAQSGERLGFSDLHTLHAYLESLARRLECEGEDPDGPE